MNVRFAVWSPVFHLICILKFIADYGDIDDDRFLLVLLREKMVNTCMSDKLTNMKIKALAETKEVHHSIQSGQTANDSSC